MTTRKNTFLLKRSNVPGKVPSPGDLQLGELALNTADAILYTSGTTANQILPIGWDRLSTLSGGTVNGDVTINGFVSATTYYNLPTFSGEYLPLSGGTVYGNTIFTSGLTANTLTVEGLTQTSGITSTGGITFKQVTINSSYTATTSDYMIDVTGGTFTVVLPSAVGIQGRLLVVKNNGGGAVTVQPVLGQNIDDKPFVILGETNTIQLASNGSNWVAISYNISTVNSSTGVFEFTGLTKVSATTFNVAPIKGWIVDDTTNPLSPQLYYIDYSGGTHTDNYVNTDFETFVYLTLGNTIAQQPIPLTEQQRRQNIFLGKLGHPDKTSINLVFSQPDFVLSPLAQLRDMFVPINLINGGVVPSTNGTNLKFNTNAGYIHGLGINFTNDILNPNTVYIPGTNPCTFQYRTQTGGTVTNVTDIDPLNYDVGGVITPVTGTKATNQRIYLLQNGSFRVMYGQTTYNTLALAIESLQTESFTPFPNFVNNAVLIGILTVLTTATDLTDTSKARFFFASKFGETVGAAGGTSTTNLQQAYNNSSNPEIITNTIQGGVQFRSGTGSNTDKNIIIENNSSVETAYIRADGKALFNTISATTIGGSGSCVTDLYVSNISSCSPLNIQPNNEGNVYFGPTSAVTIDLSNKRLGIGTPNPEYRLDISGTTGRFFTNIDSDTEQQITLSAKTTSGITDIAVLSPNAGGILMGIRGVDQTLNPGFGKAGDSFIYSSAVNNGLNIISQAGSGTDDYIRFYAGQLATTGNTPDLYIQGSGSTRGYVGIGTGSPQYRLDISGTTGRLFYDGDTTRNTYRQSQIINQGPSTGITAISVTSEGSGHSLEMFSIGSGVTNSIQWRFAGEPGDVALYASSAANNLNIMNNLGSGTTDNIRFYVGGSGHITGQTPSMIIIGSGSTKGYVGIGTVAPTAKLHVSGDSLVNGTKTVTDRSNLQGGHFSFQGTDTVGGTYTNQWQKVCSFGNPLSVFDYGTFVIKVDVGGNTTNLNTSADVNISYKQQSGSWYVYANIINYGRTPLISDNFDILLNTSAETITVYHKLTQNFDRPTYTYVGYTPPGLVNYGTVVGASLSGETSNSWTQKFITNGLTSNVVNGYLGVGTTTPSAKLHINNTTTGDTFLAEDSTNPDSTPFVISNSGNVGIGLTTPLYPLHIRAAAVASTNEPIVRVQVSDSDAYFAINNAVTTDSVFVPELLGRGDSTNSQTGIVMGAYIDSTQDVGTNPVTVFRSGLSSIANVTTRPLFDFRNLSTSVMLIDANGDLGIGTSNPTSRLTVVTSSGVTGSYPANSGTLQTGEVTRLRNGGSNLVFDIGGFSSNGNWLQSTNQTDLSLTYPLLLNPNGGKVGINLTSPSESLHVSGNTYVSGEITTDSVVTMPNFKYIQNKNDFPTAIGGIITLSGDTTYFINTTVDLTGDRLVAGQNTTILGGSSENSRLKSTGLSGTALLSSAWSIPMRGLTIESDVALNLDAGGNTNQAIDWFGINFTNCNTIGLIKDYSNIIWTDCAILESANLTFSGTIATIGFSTCLFNGISGKTIFNIPSGCSITRRFRPIYSSFIVLPGETGITISNSAIVNNDGFILDTINFAGGGTYISGLDSTSAKSLFSNNVGILNSSNVGHYYMINNTTNTTIGVPNVNVWVKAAGTTTLGIGNSPRWIANGNNRLDYTGNTQQDFKFTAVGTVQSASVNQVISVGLAINGTIQTESEITVRTATANQPYPFAIQDLAATLSAGAYIEVFVLNTQSPDIRVGDLNVIIDKISV